LEKTQNFENKIPNISKKCQKFRKKFQKVNNLFRFTHLVFNQSFQNEKFVSAQVELASLYCRRVRTNQKAKWIWTNQNTLFYQSKQKKKQKRQQRQIGITLFIILNPHRNFYYPIRVSYIFSLNPEFLHTPTFDQTRILTKLEF